MWKVATCESKKVQGARRAPSGPGGCILPILAPLRASCSHLYPAQRSLRAQLLDGRIFSRPVVLCETSLHARPQSTRSYHSVDNCYIQSSAEHVLARRPQNRAQSPRCRSIRVSSEMNSGVCNKNGILELPSVLREARPLDMAVCETCTRVSKPRIHTSLWPCSLCIILHNAKTRRYMFAMVCCHTLGLYITIMNLRLRDLWFNLLVCQEYLKPHAKDEANNTGNCYHYHPNLKQVGDFNFKT
jgi:hypothetical protein